MKTCANCKYCGFESMTCMKSFDKPLELTDEMLYGKTKCFFFKKGVNHRDLPRSKKWSEDDDNVYVHCPRCDAKRRMNLRFYLFEADGMEYYRCEECGKLFGAIELEE